LIEDRWPAKEKMNKKPAILFLLIFALSPLVKMVKHRRHSENTYSYLASELQNHPDRLVVHLTPMIYYPTLYYSHGATAKQKVAWSEALGQGYVLDYNVKGEALSGEDLVEIDSGLRIERVLCGERFD